MAWGVPFSIGLPASDGGGTTAVLTVLTPPSIGDTIVVAVAYSSTLNGVFSLVDDAGNTYTLEESRLVNGRASMQYTAPCTSVPTTVTLTMNNSTGDFMIAAAAASGGTTTMDSHTNANGTSGTPSTTKTIVLGTTLSLANATRPVVTEDLVAPANWTNLFRAKHATANLWIYMDYALNLTPGSTTWAPTGSSAAWTACDVSYAPASVGGMENFLPCIGAG